MRRIGTDNMDYELEKKMIRSFMNKNFQERLYYELTNKKRDVFIQKMCQYHDDYLKKECIIQRSTKNPSYHVMQQIFKKYDASKRYYILSFINNFDGVYVELETAVEKLSLNGFASFIIGLPSGFTHFKGESYASTQPNFYLNPLNRFDGKPWCI